MAIIVDVETVAIADAADYIEPVSAPSNYKDPAKIAEYIAKAEVKQRDEAGLYPYTARVIAVGWCESGDEVEHVLTCDTEAREASVLRELWSRVLDSTTGHVMPLVTFNGRRFDLPLLMVRSTLLGVEHPTLNLDRYRSPHPDMLELLTYNGVLDYRSLTFFAKRFGLDTSDAFSGKEVAGLYEDQNWDAIKAHCVSDVRLTRQLAERLGIIKARPRVAA